MMYLKRISFSLSLVGLLLAAACLNSRPTPNHTASPEPPVAASTTRSSTPPPDPLTTAAPPQASDPAQRAIAPETAGQVVELAVSGRGALLAAPHYSPDGQGLAVPTAAGTYVYPENFSSEPVYFPVSTPFTAFSPDGSRLAAGGPGAVTLWDTASGARTGTLSSDPQMVYWELTFSPSGSLITAASADRTVSVWDTVSGELLFSFPGDRIAFSPDGSSAAVTLFGENDVRSYALDSGEETGRWDALRAGYTAAGQLWLEEAEVVRLYDPARKLLSAPFQGTRPAFSPDGTLLALYSARLVSLYEIGSGRRVLQFEGRYAGLESLAFSPDGETLAGEVLQPRCETCSELEGLDRSLVLWRAGDGSTVARIAPLQPGSSFSPDGQVLAVRLQETVQRYRTADGALLDEISGFDAAVIGMALTPDGRTAITAHATDPYTLRFRDLETGELIRTLTGRQAAAAETHLDLAVSLDGGLLAVNGDIWDLETGLEVPAVEQAISNVTSCWSSAVAFAPQADVLATGCFAGQLDLWQMPGGGLLRRLEGFSGWVNDAAFSPDGEQIAAVYGVPDDRVQVWNAAAGEPAFALTGARYTRAAFSPDGRLLAAGELDPANEMYGRPAGPVGLWDAGTGSPFARLDGPGAVSFAFSPDGQLLAAGTLAGPVQLWDPAGGAITDLNGHFAAVQEVLFEPGGTRLVSASLDGTVRLWGLPPVEAGADWPVYSNAACGFRLAYPPGWRVLETPAGVYETAGPEVWLAAGALPMPQTGSRADITVQLLDRDPLPDWSPEKFDGYKREDLNPESLAAVQVTGVNRESGFVETAVIVELPACWLLVQPNGGAAAEAYFDLVIRTLLER